MRHTLVMTAINSLSMVVFYAPLATFLLDISGIEVPWLTIGLAVIVYICTPLLAGHFTRKLAIRRKGVEWFETKMVPRPGKIAIFALLVTLVVLFTYQGGVILQIPLAIDMTTAGIFANILLVFVITYLLFRLLKMPYEDAVPTAIIAGSNHFEVAIAVATTLFGVGPAPLSQRLSEFSPRPP